MQTLVKQDQLDGYSTEERARIIFQLVAGSLIGDNTAERLAALPLGQRALFLLFQFDAQVRNGGLHQYFSNSSGNFAHQNLAASIEVKAVESAQILKEALNLFPGGYAESDRIVRSRQLDEMKQPGTKRSEWDPFTALDKQYYALVKTPSAPRKVCERFLETNLDKFIG